MEQKPCIDQTGKIFSNPPIPRGMSGGGAWLVIEDLPDPHCFLEGIFIEHHKGGRKKYLFSTQLKQVIDFINQANRIRLEQINPLP